MRRHKLFVVAVMCVLVLGSASLTCAQPVMRLAGLLGPTGMGMAELLQRNAVGETAIAYDVLLSGSPDDLVGKIISGEVDVAAVPTNLAALLYNRTGGQIQFLATNTLGVLYVLEQGHTIHSVADLAGRTIHVSGQGATPDFVLRYLLAEHGLNPQTDVQIDFTLQHSLLAAAAAAGDVEIALLPQPHVTTALLRNPDLRVALDLTEEWDAVVQDDGILAMGCLIVQKAFAEQHSDTLELFLEEYAQSVEFVNANMEQAARFMVEHGILPNEQIALAAIPLSRIVYIDAEQSSELMNPFYGVLFGFEPRSIGGSIPDEGFYYQP